MDVRDRLARFLDELAGPGGGSGEALPNRIVAARVDSTNRLARRVVSTYLTDEMRPPGFVVLALEQSGGRGRRGRAWASPPGAGVYATRVLPLPDEPEAGEATARALQSLPLLAGVGLARALGAVLQEGGSESRCGLKWPNDVLIDGRKVAGVLAESVSTGSAGPSHPAGSGTPVAILGFGVNHVRTPDLPETATALADHTEAPLPLGAFARALIDGLDAELARLGDLGYAVPAYRELSVHRPGDRVRCRVGEETVEGELLGFDDRGHLRLRRGGEEISIAAGEIVEDHVVDGTDDG